MNELEFGGNGMNIYIFSQRKYIFYYLTGKRTLVQNMNQIKTIYKPKL